MSTRAFYDEYAKLTRIPALAQLHRQRARRAPPRSRRSTSSRPSHVIERNRVLARTCCAARGRARAIIRTWREIRQHGMIVAIEMVTSRAGRVAVSAWQERRGCASAHALARGVLLRPIGNVVYFMPPYVIERRTTSSSWPAPRSRASSTRSRRLTRVPRVHVGETIGQRRELWLSGDAASYIAAGTALARRRRAHPVRRQRAASTAPHVDAFERGVVRASRSMRCVTWSASRRSRSRCGRRLVVAIAWITSSRRRRSSVSPGSCPGWPHARSFASKVMRWNSGAVHWRAVAHAPANKADAIASGNRAPQTLAGPDRALPGRCAQQLRCGGGCERAARRPARPAESAAVIAVGPEGGMTTRGGDDARARGIPFAPASGHGSSRADTAGPACIATLQALWGGG